MRHGAEYGWVGGLGCGLAFGMFGLIASAVAGDPPRPAKVVPTFTKDVAPIIQAKCLNCHRRHQVGPFVLETYEQARRRAKDIALVAQERSMPPWKPTPGVGPKLKHDQSLSAAQVATLAAWAEAGAPRGDPKDLPPPRNFAEGWKLGPPDLVLEPAEDFPIPASGPDTYRCFVLPTNLTSDTYLEAIDYQAGHASVVHHVISYIDTTGVARQLDEAEPGPGYTSSLGGGNVGADELGFWTAGSEPHRLPDGVGIRLPRQSDIILQVHYHPNGKPGADRTRMGLYFAKKPVKQALHWNNASSYDFRLPAGNSNVEVKASWYIPVALEAIAVAPHMHQLGHDMRMTVVYPDGKSRDLIHIADWDASWQNAYYFQVPVPLPAGSTVKVVAHFDNSAHARNPNKPPKLVKYGTNADDEMCVGYIAVVKKGQDLSVPYATDDLFDIFKRQRIRQGQRQASKSQR
ncbi:MAG: putative rane protein [Planctomycetota bacterium]|nr:putative rane protein [Planctomycetota bacterium]